METSGSIYSEHVDSSNLFYHFPCISSEEFGSMSMIMGQSFCLGG